MKKPSPAGTAKRFIAHFATSGRLEVVEVWLGRNAKSNWTIKTEGASEDLSVKKYMISFSDKGDYDVFRTHFTPGQAVKAESAAGVLRPSKGPKEQ